MAGSFGAYVYASACGEQRTASSCLPSTFFGGAGLGLSSVWDAPSRLDWAVSSKGLPVSVLLVLPRLTGIHYHTSLSLYCFWVSKSGPRAYETSSLLTKPSP